MKSSRFLFRLPCSAPRAGLKIDNSDSHSRDDSAARSLTVPVTLAVGVWAQPAPKERRNPMRLQPRSVPASFAKTKVRRSGRLLIILTP